MGDAELMFEFVSLGEDCEFSFIQRRAGAEPLEMLRFAGTTIAELNRGFSESFAAVGHPLHTYIKVTPNKEVWCMNRRHDFAQHVFRNPDELDLKAFAKEQCSRLQFLRRKFFEDIEEGEKIFVYKRREPIEQHEVARLHRWLRRAGPATLLWVTTQDANHPPGQVERLGEGFLKGYIDAFTPFGRAAFGSLPVWLQICRNARRLHTQTDAEAA